MHKEALELSCAIKKKNIEEIIMKVIQYEVELIEKEDISAHTISEAIDGK